MKIDQNLVKCSLTVGALFVVFSHPFLYRALHRQFSGAMAFVDMNMCPTEGGVFVHAILFALTIYFGKKLYETHYGKKKVKINNNDPVSNEIKGKCKVYCENISNEIKKNNVNINNTVEQNLPNQVQLKLPNILTNNIPKVNNANLANLQNNMQNNNMQNNMQNNNMQNNNMQNNNMQNNNMQNNMQNNNMQNNMQNNNMQNNMQNNTQNNMQNNAQNNGLTNNMDYNNVSNTNIMGTQSTEINNLNNQGSLSCGNLPNFTNQLGGGGNDMFMENTTYHDDMFMRL